MPVNPARQRPDGGVRVSSWNTPGRSIFVIHSICAV
jgi:hypothetical protein